ncbi:hypothetical protein D3C81_1500580 [compost metagenome]
MAVGNAEPSGAVPSRAATRKALPMRAISGGSDSPPGIEDGTPVRLRSSAEVLGVLSSTDERISVGDLVRSSKGSKADPELFAID